MVDTMAVALVVEDEPEFSSFVLAVFERAGFEAFVIEYIIDTVQIIEEYDDVEILFINFSEGGYGLDLAWTVSRRWPAIKLILSAQVGNLRALPPAVFVAKPTTPAVLIKVIEYVALPSANNRTNCETLH